MLTPYTPIIIEFNPMLPTTPPFDVTLPNATILERFGENVLAIDRDGYYIVVDGCGLVCATPSRTAAVETFWRVCGFD